MIKHPFHDHIKTFDFGFDMKRGRKRINLISGNHDGFSNFKRSHHFLFAPHLEGSNGCALEPEIGLEILSNLPYKTLERQLPDEQLRRLLVTTDLTEGHSSRPVTVGLLHTAGGRRGLPRRLGGQLLPGGLASGRLTSSLLSTGHLFASSRTGFFQILYRRVLENGGKDV